MRSKSLFSIPVLLFTILSGCSTDNSKEAENRELYQKLDSVQKELTLLRKELNPKPDTVLKDTMKQVEKPIKIEEKKQERIVTPAPSEKEKKPAKEIIKTREVVKNNSTPKEDTVFYYYKDSKKVSAKFSPWKNEHRKLLLYDPFGKLTYQQEDVRMSYSSTTEIKEFHPNGAIAKIKIHMNPGASMYWYETVITFGDNNEPQWKTDMKYPASMSDYVNNTSYWDKKIGQWKKQEIIQEQPVPQK